MNSKQSFGYPVKIPEINLYYIICFLNSSNDCLNSFACLANSGSGTRMSITLPYLESVSCLIVPATAYGNTSKIPASDASSQAKHKPFPSTWQFAIDSINVM